MASIKSTDIPHDIEVGAKGFVAFSEKPLANAIICCTSIPPETRSQYAEWAEQMGAEHSLDLTSGVTHLLVADTNTEKYRYVAKEREDIKVLRPEWLEAVRKNWMEDIPIDHNMLEKEYWLPTFAGLKICITGFDDLTFRARLQRNIIENGAKYTGDLTKEVTHLIVAKTDGKKYEYALQWGIKTVSLNWYKDSLERGMQLAEECYNPSMPVEEQGKGAWNRQVKQHTVLGKRSSSATTAAEPQRKLRRTASAKFGSQRDGLWNEIVSGPGSEVPDDASQPVLRPSRSMPALKQETQDIAQHDSAQHTADDRRVGFLNDCVFVVLGFDEKKEIILRNVLLQHGATICGSLSELNEQNDPSLSFVMVPYTSSKDKVEHIIGATVVTEFWIERCMEAKAFVKPQDYPIGQLVERPRLPEIGKLVINATGFYGIECLHISKIVKFLGASYQETFTSCISVLVCKSKSINPEKVRHAVQWNVPIVSETWLHSLVRDGRVPSISRHQIPGIGPQGPRRKLQSDAPRKRNSEQENQEAHEKLCLTNTDDKGLNDLQGRDAAISKSTADVGRPGSDFRLHDDQPAKHQSAVETREATGPGAAQEHKSDVNPRNKTRSREQPLKEISPNPLPAQDDRIIPKRRLLRNLDGNDSSRENDLPGPMIQDYNIDKAAVSSKDSADGVVANEDSHPTAEIVRSAGAINGAIQELLDLKAKTKAVSAGEDGSKKKRLLGRALSNLSNSSRTSQNRATRANSIDSVNTEGLGNEIVPSDSTRSSTNEGRQNRSSSSILTGRASGRPSAHEMPYALDDMMSLDGAQEPESEPKLTQLGYEDPVEAIQLREALAERRRQKAKLGQKAEDSKPQEKQKATKKLQDDDLMTAAAGGWGLGARRTRQRDKTSPGLKGF